MMKKLSCLLALLCCMMMSLSVAYASPLTGDTSNMGLWIAMVVVAVVLLVVLVIMGKRRNGDQNIKDSRSCAAGVFLCCCELPAGGTALRTKQNGHPFGYPLSLVHQPILLSFSVSALFLWAALFLCSRPLAAALSIALTATL